MYHQNYNPTGSVVLSTIVAAIPIVVLLYFIALHPHRDKQGLRHLGIAAPQAAFCGVLAAFLVSCLAFGMPLASAFSAFALGTLSGFLGIIWIVLAAMFLYTMTVITGKFEIVKESITHISFDRRLQVLLIAFSFGAIIEGTSGFGTPVAIAGAVMVGLGFAPFQSAVLNLLANTAPVAWGAIGSPIVGLALSSGLPQLDLSTMAGRQLPFASILVPFWLVAVFVKMEGGSWREAFEVWPATVVAGGVFALVQWIVSAQQATYLLTDVLAGLASVLAVVLFLRVWRPKTRFLLQRERLEVAGGLGAVGPGAMAAHPRAGVDADAYRYPYSLRQTIEAWVPWMILIACVVVWGLNTAVFNDALPVPGRANATTPVVLGTPFGITVESTSFTRLFFDMPAADKQIQRTSPVVTPCPPGQASTPQAPCVGPERVQFTLNWLSAAGTATVLAAILSGLFLRLSLAQWAEAIGRTARRLRVPILVICQVLGLASLTRFAGTDAILGLAFTVTGPLYPFFAAYLGWLGVFLTGSDTASNALFGSLQRITAEQLHLNPVLAAART